MLETVTVYTLNWNFNCLQRDAKKKCENACKHTANTVLST